MTWACPGIGTGNMTMAATSTFKLGLEFLLENHPSWLEEDRIGLVSHTAAVDRHGQTSAEQLHHTPGVNLTALFGPEHGFTGQAAAGEPTQDSLHTDWKIPVFSLYGETRKPTPAMLQHVDTLIIEFQDLGARPYTYVSTLRLVLEAAAETEKKVIIADRPVPLPCGSDGPMLNPAFETFVGLIPGPMQYGMTQGETARWLNNTLGLGLDLRIAPMQGYTRKPEHQPEWPAWKPPSPRIRTWDAASLFTCTVFGEALPALDYGSGTELAFQVIGAPWLDAARLSEWLADHDLPGIRFDPVRYHARSGLYTGTELNGLRLVITNHGLLQPVSTAVTLLAGIQSLYGTAILWNAEGTREEWFDKLFGTNTVRLALQSGMPASDIITSWQPDQGTFRTIRAKHLLYSTPPPPPPEP